MLSNTEKLEVKEAPFSEGFSPKEASNLVNLLSIRAQLHPEKTAFSFLRDGEKEDGHCSYALLDRQARAIAGQLLSRGLKGERVLMLYPSGLEYIAAFFGCLYAGAIAVPAYPPKQNRLSGRIASIMSDAGITTILTTEKNRSKLVKRLDDEFQFADIKWVTTDLIDTSEEVQPPPLDLADDLAFLQYTSGSTGDPKGVMVTHANLMYNLEDMKESFEISSESVMVSWLPIFHDMGLILGILSVVYSGATGYLMSPVSFLEKPFRWLKAIADHKGTHTAAPDFAFAYCTERISDEQKKELDLKSWKVAVNGAEPVLIETVEAFYESFRDCGLSEKTMTPGYGLAETTLKVTGQAVPEACRALNLDAKAFSQGILSDDPERKEDSKRLINCGLTKLQTKVVIADPESHVQCADGRIGEIWVHGPTVAKGYWNRPEETEKTFAAHLADTGEGPFLRTGDLGFLQEGELYVTGRLKDVIIVRGANYYPQDIEQVAYNSHEALKHHGSAAFTVDRQGEEKLVVLCEIKREALRSLDKESVVEAVKKAIMEEFSLSLSGVLLLSPASLSKTSSGKIQRRLNKVKFEEGGLKTIEEWYSPTFENRQGSTERGEKEEPINLEESQRKADALLDWLRTYASQRVNSRLMDERRSIPPYVILDFGNKGLLGAQVPVKYGGLGLGHTDFMRVLEQVGAIDQTLASFLGVNNILGIRPILRHGSKELKETYLRSLATGRQLAAFAITEPGAGSNPRNIQSQAVPIGKDSWFLTGQKIWIGNASWAGIVNVFVNQVNEDGEKVGVTGFVVPQSTLGLDQGAEALTMGMRGMVQNSIDLNYAPVNGSLLLGEASKGMEVAQDTMMYARLGIAAIALGAMKRCAQIMSRYGENRAISTGKLMDNPVTLIRMQHLLLQIKTIETLIYSITKLLDQGKDIPSDIFAICKTTAPEYLYQATDHLVQLLGGRGYIETNMAPQMLRDARLLRIFEGPTETLQMFLGSRLANGTLEIIDFIKDALGSPEIAAELENASKEVMRMNNLDNQGFQNRNTGLHYTNYLIGGLTSKAVMWAIMAQSATENPRDESAGVALNWIKGEFDSDLQHIRKAMSCRPSLNLEKIGSIISGYENSIGNIHQSMLGEDHDFDIMLAQAEKQTVESKLRQEQPSGQVSRTESPEVQLVEWLRKWMVDTFKLRYNQVREDSPFMELGMDSVTSVVLAKELGDKVGVPLDETVVWNYPTIQQLTAHLQPKMGGRAFQDEDGHDEKRKNGTEGENNGTPSKSYVSKEAVSEDEITALLKEKLKQIKRN